MYKIFINEKPFIISTEDVADKAFEKCKRVKHDPAKTIEIIKECESLRSKGYVVLCNDPDFAFKDFYTHFVAIEAAGGLVSNEAGNWLLIKRLGKWDLPKGKIDGDETPDEAALREVEEECGIKELKLLKQLPTTYHTYKLHNHRFLKITYWYAMKTTWDKPLVPQKEEHITEAVWFNRVNLDLHKLETYNSIRDLLLQMP